MEQNKYCEVEYDTIPYSKRVINVSDKVLSNFNRILNLMKNTLNKLFVIVIIGFISLSVIAEGLSLDEVRQNIVKQFDNLAAENITKSPIPGLYQVSMPPQFFYVSADGRYRVEGDLIDIKNNINVSKAFRNKSIALAINAMGEDSMIIYGKDLSKHTVTVFTDVDCFFCRKLHKEIQAYNKLGIRIRYMAFPLSTNSFKKAKAVWCNKDRNKSLTKAKNGFIVKSKNCNNPVVQHYTLATKIGVRSTPTLVFADGSIEAGYIPPAKLIEILNDK